MDDRTVEFAIGDEVPGLAGFSGELSRVVVDSTGLQLTHLVVAPRHQGGFRRLVPVELVEAAETGLRMRCTQAEFEDLPQAEEAKVVVAPGVDGVGTDTAVVVREGDRVPVANGEGGRFKGLIVRAADGGITHVIVNQGLPWTSSSRAIPVGGESS